MNVGIHWKRKFKMPETHIDGGRYYPLDTVAVHLNGASANTHHQGLVNPKNRLRKGDWLYHLPVSIMVPFENPVNTEDR